MFKIFNGEKTVEVIEKAVLEDDGEVIFDDINLETFIRKIIGKKSGKILKSEIYNIKKLDFKGWPLISIRGIENMPNIEELSLYQSKMNNIIFLSKLKKLKKLDLAWSDSISDIRPLAELKELEELQIYYSSNVTNFPYIGEIETLRVLDISENKLSVIDFVYKLKNLEELNLSKNNIGSISFIEEMNSMRRLDISAGNIFSIESIEKLKNLEELDISANKITDLSPLLHLEKLSFIDMRGNKIDFGKKENKEVMAALKMRKCKVKK